MTVNSKIKLLLFGLILSAFQHCKTKTGTNKSGQIEAVPFTKTFTTSRFDTIIRQLKSNREVTKSDLLLLAVIDSTYANASTETTYCDTTVQLSDSLFYSVLTLSEEGGNCSHSFIVTIDEKNKRAVSSRYLKPDCDIDYSWNNYDLFDYKVISKDTVQLNKTTVFQKKNKTSDDEEENVDYKQTEKSYFIILPSGQIADTKNNSF